MSETDAPGLGFQATDDDLPEGLFPPSTAVAPAAAPPRDMTLYGISTELVELLAFRESLYADQEMTEVERKASIEACETALAQYVATSLAKDVDAVTANFREFENRDNLCRKEAARILAAARAWGERYLELERMVKVAMSLLGKKRLDGLASSLAVKKNPASVNVRQPDLVPTEYSRVTVTISTETWEALQSAAIDLGDCPKDVARILTEIARSKASAPEFYISKISEQLKAGVGVPGCQLNNETFRLEVK